MAACRLAIEGLSVTMAPPRLPPRPVLIEVSLSVEAGQVLALVGESGSGKSTCLRAMMGLLPAAARVSGSVIWQEEERRLELRDAPLRVWRQLRGRTLAWIAQEPAAALNPRLTAAAHVRECWRAHAGRASSSAVVHQALEAVGLPSARGDDYPFQWSGGMRQRLLIAMALVQRPRVLLADEFTSALDTENQRQLLTLLRRLAREREFGLCLATHDLALAAECADEVAVLYAGRIVERGRRGLLAHPRHPYTRALAACQPASHCVAPPPPALPGAALPSAGAAAFVSACAFEPRCPVARADCAAAVPQLAPLLDADAGYVRCPFWAAPAPAAARALQGGS